MPPAPALTADLSSSPDAAAPAVAPAPSRLAFVDAFRGLLICHMALDHASQLVNMGRWHNEWAVSAPAPPPNLAQFAIRFSGVFVAPGFALMAGFMVAVTSVRRRDRGGSSRAVDLRLAKRGLVLLLVEQLLLRPAQGITPFHHFGVLAMLGVCLPVLALLRHARPPFLWALAAVTTLLHPWLHLGALPPVLAALLHDVGPSRVFSVSYPFIPWIGILLAGYLLGADQARQGPLTLRWAMLGGVGLLVFLVVRLSGVGNAYPTAPLDTVQFWIFSKYPPDLPWITLSLSVCLLLLAALRRLDAGGRSPFRGLAVFGQVPFFFYLAHALVIVAAYRLHLPQGGLPWTFATWAILCGLLVFPCHAYAAAKRRHPGSAWTYL